MEAGLLVGADGARIGGIGVRQDARRPGPDQAIDERANEGGAVAATGHVRLADELIDAARAGRMDAEPVIRPRRLIVTLKIGEGPPVDRHDELRSEEHTSELQSLRTIVSRLLLENKK